MTDRREQGITGNGEEFAKQNKKTRTVVRTCHIYTDEEKEFFREFVPGHSYAEIREAFIEKFGWEIRHGQIKGHIKRYKLNTGRNGQFPKGHVPANKGQKMSKEMYERAKPTMFKKGQMPINHRSVGSERITVDGYIEIKVKEPRTWKLKHRVIWEQHYGPLPKNHAIIFLDGNKLNTDISNLKLISRRELLVMNRKNLFSEDAELTDAGSNLAKLICRTYEVMEDNQNAEKG